MARLRVFGIREKSKAELFRALANAKVIGLRYFKKMKIAAVVERMSSRGIWRGGAFSE